MANGYLRRRFQSLAREEGWDLHIPSPRFCTDNAAMIAWLGNYYLEQGVRDSLDWTPCRAGRWEVPKNDERGALGAKR